MVTFVHSAVQLALGKESHTRHTITPRNSTSSLKSASYEEQQFSYIDTAGLSDDEVAALKGRLINESREMLFKFQSLVNALLKSLHNQGITPSKLASRLFLLGAFISVKPHKPLLEDCLLEIRNADSLDDAFWSLRDYCSFFNYYVIEHITRELGTEDDQSRLQEYKEDLKEYSKRRCFECPIEFGHVKTGHAKLRVKLDIHYEGYRVEELQAFQSSLAKILQVSEESLHLNKIGEGCVQFTFQIPSFIKEAIFPLSPEQERALLDERVVELECDEYKFSKEVSV